MMPVRWLLRCGRQMNLRRAMRTLRLPLPAYPQAKRFSRFFGFSSTRAGSQRRTTSNLVDTTYIVEEASAAYRRLAWLYHPDVGGTNEAMAALNVARDWIEKRYGERAGRFSHRCIRPPDRR